MTNWIDRDKAHLWHPLTQHGLGADHLPIVKAEGLYLYDHQGKKYMDAIASWYTCMYGHSNPALLEAVKAGLDELDQVVFSGFTHPAAIKFSEALAEVLPGGVHKIFFSDNGSTTVDVALKMAFQYHFNQGRKCRKVVALKEGFHGDTFGAMSVSDLSVYNGPFEEFFLEVVRFDWENDSLSDFEKLMQDPEVASFVYEPLVQGAAGMKLIPADKLNQMIGICHDQGKVAIADEVMTGFGKTGTIFASEQMDNQPDIICLSKSLTGGIAPMGVTCANDRIYNAFLSDKMVKGFFHGHTYSANPLACNAATAALSLLRSEEYQTKISTIAEQHRSFAGKIEKHSKVAEVRTLGVILALDLNVETERYGSFRDKLFQFFMERGVFLRPLGQTLYILPPFVIEESELTYLYSIIEESLDFI